MMGVPRGTGAPLNPVSSACNDWDFLQQKIPFGCCGSVQGTCPTLQGEHWWRAHKDKSKIIILRKLMPGTRGRIWCIFSKTGEKKPHLCIFPVWVPNHDLQGLVHHLWRDGSAPSDSDGSKAGQRSDGPKNPISSEPAAEDSLYFKNTQMGKVGLKSVLD